MLGLSVLPAMLQFLGFLFLPESPRWLIQRGLTQKARRVLSQIRGNQNIDEEYDSIKNSIEEEEKDGGGGKGRSFFCCCCFQGMHFKITTNTRRFHLECLELKVNQSSSVKPFHLTKPKHMILYDHLLKAQPPDISGRFKVLDVQ